MISTAEVDKNEGYLPTFFIFNVRVPILQLTLQA
jgi:hypothetical protein